MSLGKSENTIEDGNIGLEFAQSETPDFQTDMSSKEIELNWEGTYEKKKPGKGKIIAIVVAVIAFLGILVALLWKPIAGLFGSGNEFSSPQEHFAYVEGRAFQSLSDSIAVYYGDTIAAYDAGLTASETQMHVQLNEFILSALGTYSDLELSWLDDLLISFEYTGDLSTMQGLWTIGLGGTEVFSTDMIYDLQNFAMWIGYPELSSTYLKSDMVVIDGADLSASVDFDALMDILSIMPSEQVVRDILRRYTNIAVSNISDVTSKKQTVTIEGISQECTVLEAKIDEQTLYNIAVAALEEARNDHQLMNTIRQFMEYSDPGSGDLLALEWSVGIDAVIVNLKNQMKEIDPSAEYVLWIDYVDANNNIIGRSISMSNMDDAFRYLKVSGGSSFAYELNLMDEFVLSGTGTEKNNLINGEFALKSADFELLNFELVDLDNKKLDRGELCGTLRVKPSAEAMQMMFGSALMVDVSLDMFIDCTNAYLNLELSLLINDQILATITSETKQKEAKPVQIPSNSINANDEVAMKEWFDSLSFAKVFDNIQKAGLPVEYADAIKEYITEYFIDAA